MVGKFTHTTSKERKLVHASSINYWNAHKLVCFLLSHVLSFTKQYKQKAAVSMSVSQ